ncbi:MAG: alanine racemase [Thermoguttaceae bacterium]|nr:alanine racemase [Thermoguttaceae bacterium]
MKSSVSRRKFLAFSAASALAGVTRRGWAEQPAPMAGIGLNDYCVAEVSASALKHNIALIRRELKPATKFCAVVKANCFSLGWPACKDAIIPEADWLAVATPEEAFAVRQSGCQLPLLLLMASGFYGDLARERLRQFIAQDITLTVAASGDLARISSVAEEVGKPAKIHIKIDTGMGRSGVLPDLAPALVRQARRQSGIVLDGIYTHYATADAADKTYARGQLARFRAAVRACGAEAKGVILHTAASAATIDLPESHFDMVRVGTAMYGYQPSDEMHRVLPLRPALRVVSRLAQVKDVPAGSQVGYGLTYKFKRPARLGLVPIGYADGYRRALSNQAVMRVVGQYAPVRGRVSMDQTIIDLTDVPAAKVGDEVEVISRETEAPNSADNLALLAGTIVPEIVSGLGSRVRRVPTT